MPPCPFFLCLCWLLCSGIQLYSSCYNTTLYGPGSRLPAGRRSGVPSGRSGLSEPSSLVHSRRALRCTYTIEPSARTYGPRRSGGRRRASLPWRRCPRRISHTYRRSPSCSTDGAEEEDRTAGSTSGGCSSPRRSPCRSGRKSSGTRHTVGPTTNSHCGTQTTGRSWRHRCSGSLRAWRN